MRLSSYPINTLRDVPADAEVVSHQLMLRVQEVGDVLVLVKRKAGR